MIKFENIEGTNYSMLSFSTMQSPTFAINKVKGYVEFGKKNDFPNQLIRLYEEHPEHSAIINAKANYLIGEGLVTKDKEQQALLDSLLKYANKFETYSELIDKIKIDFEAFNCAYLQLITDLKGNVTDVYHLSYSNCRTSSCVSKLFYSENWLDKKYEVSEFNKYESGKVGAFFIRAEFYKPVAHSLAKTYPMPQYIGGIKEISTDIDISTFNQNYVANGFSAGTLVTFFNGEPTIDEKRSIKNALLNTHSGVDKAGSIVINFADKDGQAATITALNVDDLDKKFEFTSKRALDKILRAHNITNAELFGVKTEGQLGTRVSIADSFELFISTYVKPRQKVYLKLISDLLFIQKKQRLEIEVVQSKPIGLDLSNDADLTVDERRKLKGYESSGVEKTNPDGTPALDSSVNSTLTNLSGRQFQGLMRIVTKYDNGKINKNSALALMVSGFGLSEEQALTFLNENDNVIETAKFENVNKAESIIKKFELNAIDVNESDELVSLENVKFSSNNDALLYELKTTKMFFADVLKVSVTQLKDSILATLKGNPTLTIDELTTALKANKNDVINAVNELKESGLIEPKVLEPTAKAYEIDTTPQYRTDVYTVYKYDVRDDVPRTINGSRDFCKKLMQLSKAGKRWNYEFISSLQNDMDENVNAWDYRGGYYTNPNTKETTPYCRHVWQAETRVRKTKI